MKARFFSLLIGLLFWLPTYVIADPILADGVYYISCQQGDGYVGLGEYHDVNPYICYITDGSAMTDDAYWVVTNTQSGYTFCNEASGQYIVFTYDRVDAYYKYLTLADQAPADGSQYWDIIEQSDGSLAIQSRFDPAYCWNLRLSQGLLGTYSGSGGGSNNERYYFKKKGSEPDPAPGPDPGPDPQVQPLDRTSFPAALHVFLKDGRMEAYPLEYVTKHSQTNGELVIETNIGQTFTYPLANVASYSDQAPTDFPTFESFKFNNKFNDQLFTDAEGEMIGDTVFVTIAAIGKRLTPSFKLPDGEDIEVYVNNVRQESKVSRLRFDKDIYYVITRPNYQMLLPVESSEKGATSYKMQPYGRIVRVHVDWLTDRAEVPTIYINTLDGEPITSKYDFKDASIIIDGHGIFPSMEETPLQIKGRGNSSWGWSKKPYRLKFEDKVKPLGMTKGKNWVLLANGQRGSLMSNAIGMKAANLMKASAANHIVPVDLYLNGEYRGSYNLTEKVGLANNSVDLEDESAAALLELDSYYDEPDGQKFRSQPYNLPINIKEPEFDEGTTRLTLETIASDFNSFMKTLSRGQNISKHVDVEQLVRFLMVNELILNYEFYHPKSTFCYRESFESDTSKYVFGPVWDLDWAFGYERAGNYFRNEATYNYWLDGPNMEVVQFVRDLRFKYTPLSDVYKSLWEKFMDNDLEELLEYCQDYYDFAHNSFDLNRDKWGDNTDYGKQVEEATTWLDTRAHQIYDDILSGKRPELPDPEENPIIFDNNKLYTLTCRRGALVLNEGHTGLAAGQTRTDAPEEDQQFAILHIAGYNYLYSPVTKQFLNCASNGFWSDELTTPVTFSDTQADEDYLYMLSYNNGSNVLYFNNNGNIVINSYSKPDEGNRWLIEEVGDFDPTDAMALAYESLHTVTNRIMFNGKVVGTETYHVPDGANVPEPAESWTNSFISLKEPADIPYAVYDDLTLDYEADWTGPFKFSTSANDATWYNMTIRSEYFVNKDESEPYYPTVVDDQALTTETYHWAFGGDPYHVKIYNRTTGFTETLTKDGNNAVMRSGDYIWDLQPNSDGFILRETGTEHNCINQYGGKTGPLQFWNDDNSLHDNGSTFRVMEALEELREITANDLTMVYGDPVPNLTYSVSGIGLEGTPNLSTTATSSSPVGTYPISIERGTVNNKNIQFQNGTLTILPAPLTVGVNDVTITEGDALPTFTLTYNGLKNNDTAAKAFTKTPKATTTATATSTPGSYPITVSGGESTNYTISYTSGTLTIKEIDIYIVTYQVMFDNQPVAQATESVTKGSKLPSAPAELSNSYITLTKTGTHPSTVTKDVTVTFNAKWSGPFEFSKQEANATWYNMTVRNNYYVSKQDSEPYYPAAAEIQDLTQFSYQWAFGGDPYHVKVYNRATGFSETLAKDGDNVVMRSGNYTWDLLPNSDGFVLRETGTRNTCVNQKGGANGPLQLWDSYGAPSDEGSTFRIHELIDKIMATHATSEPSVIYDLAGRRLQHAPKRGVYIINHRKVFIP
ncbi:MAG: CotH kinase family protein [Bacteroidaceae bacterium]|nr:CotH kinase family protein [Bacteroidaceae bacterium]